jgi:hypothetical protein
LIAANVRAFGAIMDRTSHVPTFSFRRSLPLLSPITFS